MTPKQTRQHDRRPEQPPSAPPGDAMTLDPDFDELDGADAEWCAWRWPDRERSE